MKTLNNVKNSLLNLGLKKGLDLTDPKVAKSIDPLTGLPICNKNYSAQDDWENEFQENLKYFFYYMQKYQTAIDKNNLKVAHYKLSKAVLYADHLYQFFFAISMDISAALYTDAKINNIPWPQFEDTPIYIFDLPKIPDEWQL